MHLNKTKMLIPAILSIIGLLGCGDGTNSKSASNSGAAGDRQQTPPRAGETFTASILVDDKPITETKYLVYSVVNNEGKLSDQPQADTAQEDKLPHVLLKQSTETLAKVSSTGSVSPAPNMPKLAPPIPLSKVETCYSDIWKKLHSLQPNATPQQLAARITQFGVSIDDLCTYIPASGLTLDQYVDLFQTATKYFPESSNIERHIFEFFLALNITPKNFITKLTSKGYNWEEFVKRISANKKGVYAFVNGYNPNKMSLEQYIADYMSRPAPVVAEARGQLKLLGTYLTKDVSPGFLVRLSPPHLLAQTAPSYTDVAKEVIDVIDKGMVVGKKIWDFLKDNKAVVDDKANNVSTYVLSATDPSLINYGYAKASSSPKVSFVGKRLWWENYRADISLDVDYDGRNTAAPGQWLPNVMVKVHSIKADWGYTLNGDAKISTVVNRASAEAPAPEIQVVVTMIAKNWSVNQQSFTFSANGANGASLK